MNILYRSAFDLARDIKSRRLRAREVLAFFMQRVERFNPGLNAVIALDTERATARATAADVAADNGEDWGPLHGVPVTIKDAFCTEGLVTVGGIPDCREYVPRSNAVAVQRYLDAGAIVFGKTNVPYMSADLQSFNDVYGTTNNPWDPARTCGGSSGGAAAAVAAGLTPLEIGSDIGGSIRVPSHFNGVFGHKTSFGIVPQAGHLPPGEFTSSETDLSVVGPIGNCVADLQQALDILAGPSAEESAGWQLSLPEPSFDTVPELKVALWADDAFCPVEREVEACLHSVADTLETLGAAVDRSARPNFDPERNHYNYIQLLMAAMGGGMPAEVQEKAQAVVAAAEADDMSEPTLQMRGIALSHRAWLRQNERRLKTRALWQSFFKDFDVLICPCAHVPAFIHDHEPDLHLRRLAVNGQQRPYTDLLRWSGVTLNSYLPVTAIPAGMTHDGLPVGAQIVSRYLGDRTTLAVARLLEQHHRAFVAPPGFDDIR